MNQNAAERPTETGPIAPGPGGSSPLEGTQGQEIEVWRKDTWGRWGQHDNLYTFVMDLENLTQTPIFQAGVTIRHENHDSRKNLHRRTYVRLGELTAKLQGKILKFVRDRASSANREVKVDYCLVGQELITLPAEKSLRDDKGFYDLVQLPDGRKLRVRKDAFEVISA